MNELEMDWDFSPFPGLGKYWYSPIKEELFWEQVFSSFEVIWELGEGMDIIGQDSVEHDSVCVT